MKRRAFTAHSWQNSTSSSFLLSNSFGANIHESSKCNLLMWNRFEFRSKSRIKTPSHSTLYQCWHSASLLGRRSLSTNSPTNTQLTDAEKWSRLLHRTNLCGQLKEPDEGREVNLCGWLTAVRDIGDHVFLVINDHTGSIQIVLDTPLRTARLAEVRGGCIHHLTLN